SQETTPQLVVIHLRGAHPPFDVPLERARELPPLEYGGDLHPRRAAIQLAAGRSRPRPQQRKLVDEDWTRLEALQRAALEKQDAAVARLFRWLQDEGLWDDSLVAVLGDVTTDEAPEAPYAPHPPLSEARLHAPPLVKWPGGALAAHEISQPVTTVDLSPAALAALGVEAPGPLDGVDLRDIARGRAQLPQRALFATGENSFATRAGEWLLRGDFGSVPTLCRLGPDPACVNDRLDQHPIAAASLWHWTYRRDRDERAGAPPRVQTGLQGCIRAALTLWRCLPPARAGGSTPASHSRTATFDERLPGARNLHERLTPRGSSQTAHCVRRPTNGLRAQRLTARRDERPAPAERLTSRDARRTARCAGATYSGSPTGARRRRSAAPGRAGSPDLSPRA